MASDCLICKRKAPAGDAYSGAGENGMVLDRVWICDACAAARTLPRVCAACKRSGVEGDAYRLISTKGRRVPYLWLCDDCVLASGPGQGPMEGLPRG